MPCSSVVNANETEVTRTHDRLVDVTFSVGDLRVVLNVDVDVRQVGMPVLEQGTVTAAQVTFGALASVEARDLLAVDVGATLAHELRFEPSGPWKIEIASTVCVRGTLVSGGPATGGPLDPRFAEVVGSAGSFCITDTGATDLAFLNVLGVTTPVEQRAALPGNDTFHLILDGQIADVFDGETLKQRALETPHSFNIGHFTHRIVDQDRNEIVADLFGPLSGAFSIRPAN